ncbi:MAG: hypothetical protein ACOC22_04505 [bacterium]
MIQYPKQELLINKRNIMRIQIYIITVLLITTLSNCNQVPKQINDDLKTNLIIYEESNGDFSFLSTSNPQIDKIEQKTTDGQPYIMYIYSYDYCGYSFSICYYPILYHPLNINNENEILLDNMVSGAAKNSNGNIEKSIKIEYKKFPGRQYIINYPDGKIKSNLFLINRQVYILAVQSKLSNETFDNAIISTFFNSFYKKIEGSSNIKSTEIETSEIKPEINCKDIESFLLSDIKTIDFNLKSRGWQKFQELSQEKFGIGYQYIYESKDELFQLIIYPEVKALVYVPDKRNYKIIENEVKKNYSFHKTELLYGQKQHTYRNSTSRIHICPEGPKKMITAFWGHGE